MIKLSSVKKQRPLLFKLMVTVVATLLAVVFSPLSQSASAAYNPGRVCNYSSTSILITAQPANSSSWGVYRMGYGCTGFLSYDVEAIWGRRCDTGGRCWYVAWKVNGYTTTTVRNGYTSPIPPGRALYVSGWGSWTIASEWPKPGLYQIGYDLR